MTDIKQKEKTITNPSSIPTESASSITTQSDKDPGSKVLPETPVADTTPPASVERKEGTNSHFTSSTTSPDLFPDNIKTPPDENFETYRTAYQLFSDELSKLSTKMREQRFEKDFLEFTALCAQYGLFTWNISPFLSRQDKIQRALNAAALKLNYYLFSWEKYATYDRESRKLTDAFRKYQLSAMALQDEIQKKLKAFLEEFAPNETLLKDINRPGLTNSVEAPALPDLYQTPPEKNPEAYKISYQSLSDQLTNLTQQMQETPSDKIFTEFASLCLKYELFRWNTSNNLSRQEKIERALNSAQKKLDYYLFAWKTTDAFDKKTKQLTTHSKQIDDAAKALREEIKAKIKFFLDKFAKPQLEAEKKNVSTSAPHPKDAKQTTPKANYQKISPTNEKILQNIFRYNGDLQHSLESLKSNLNDAKQVSIIREEESTHMEAFITYLKDKKILSDNIIDDKNKPISERVNNLLAHLPSHYTEENSFLELCHAGIKPIFENFIYLNKLEIEIICDELQRFAAEFKKAQSHPRNSEAILENYTKFSLFVHSSMMGVFSQINTLKHIDFSGDLSQIFLNINATTSFDYSTLILKRHIASVLQMIESQKEIEKIEKKTHSSSVLSINTGENSLPPSPTTPTTPVLASTDYINRSGFIGLTPSTSAITNSFSSSFASFAKSLSTPVKNTSFNFRPLETASYTPPPIITSPPTQPSTRSPNMTLEFLQVDTKKTPKPHEPKSYPTSEELDKIFDAMENLKTRFFDQKELRTGTHTKALWESYFASFLKVCNEAGTDILQKTFDVFEGRALEEYLYDLLDKHAISLPANYWQDSKSIARTDKIEAFACACFADLTSVCKQADIKLKVSETYPSIESDFLRDNKKTLTAFLDAEKYKVPQHPNYEQIKKLSKILELLITLQRSILETLANCKSYLTQFAPPAETERTYPPLIKLREFDEAQKKISTHFSQIKTTTDVGAAEKKWEEGFESLLTRSDPIKVDILPDVKTVLADYEIFYTAFFHIRTPKDSTQVKYEVFLLMFDCCNDLLAMMVHNPPKITNYASFRNAYKQIADKINSTTGAYSSRVMNLFNILTLLQELNRSIPTTLAKGKEALDHLTKIQQRSVQPRKYPSPSEINNTLEKLPDFKYIKTTSHSDQGAEDLWKRQFRSFLSLCIQTGIDIRQISRTTFKSHELFNWFLSTCAGEIPEFKKQSADIESYIYDCTNDLLQKLLLPRINFKEFSHFQSVYGKIKSAAESCLKQEENEIRAGATSSSEQFIWEINLHDETSKVGQVSLLLKTLDSFLKLRSAIYERLESSFHFLNQHSEPVPADSGDTVDKMRVIKTGSYQHILSTPSLIQTTDEPFDLQYIRFYRKLFTFSENEREFLSTKDIDFLINVLKYAIFKDDQKHTGLIYNYLEGLLSSKKIKLLEFKHDILNFANDVFKKSSMNKTASNIVETLTPTPTRSARISATPVPVSPVITTHPAPKTPSKKEEVTDTIRGPNTFTDDTATSCP